MWNNLNLKNPVHDICEYGTKDAATLQELPELISCLTASAEILTADHPIWEEIQIFKNVQAKYKRILHCDKCLQLLQRIGGCVKKMVLLNLSKVYLDIGENILKELQKSNSSSYFLPSRQQLEYVLIRTQSAAKLICEALNYSRETFCYLIQKLKVGHLILNLMMATSITARLNIVFKGLLVQLFSAYKKIYPWRKRLRKGGYEWPKTLELPADLESWINLKESEHMKPKHLPKEQLDFLSSIFDENNSGDFSTLADNDELTLLDNPELIEISESCEENDSIIVENVTSGDDIDNGVPIARSEIESNGNSFQNLQPSSSIPQRKRKSNKMLTDIQPSASSTPQRNEKKNQKSTNTLPSSSSPQRKRKSNQMLTDTLPSSSSPHKKRKSNQMLTDTQPSTSSTPQRNGNSQKLTSAQKTLLKKIKATTDMKTLKIIWNNLNVSSQDLFPEGLTAEKIRLIDKVFRKLKHDISQVKKSKLTISEKKYESEILVKAARIRLAKHLKILPDKKMKKQQSYVNILQPVKTCKGLKELYEIIYQQLQSAQEYETCSKLKKFFKRRKADIKLLIENGEKQTAKQLIFSSSKFFLKNFLKETH